ncbi:MAG: DUF3067 family protein [Pseudanabaenaceae cyanobacterium]
MTGAEIRQLLLAKWGYSYDIQLRRISPNQVQLQVMWRYQEQLSFPLSEAEYLQHLDTIASHLQAWGTADQFRQFMQTTKHKPRLGKPVVLSLNLGERAVEWLV